MTTLRFTFLSICTITLSVLAVLLTINYGPVPKWSELSGKQTQDWISGPFVRLAYIMIFLLVTSTIMMIWSLVLLRRKRPFKALWIVGIVTFLLVQVLSITLIGANYDLAMNADALAPDVAIQNERDWDFFNNVRYAVMLMNVIVLFGFSHLPKVIDVNSI